MKKNLILSLLLISPLFLISQNVKKVLIIGIDGCRPDALDYAATPNIDILVADGIYSPDALNDDITVSGPGWSAILCGVWSDKHLVTGNNFDGNDYDNYPPVFKYINEYNPDLITASICHWSPINESIIQDHTDITINVTSDLDVALEAMTLLSQNDPDVMFLHFDDVDHAGHGYGYSSTIPEYTTAIEGVDTHVGSVMEALKQRDNYESEDWLIMMTTDHGGIGSGHGGNTIEEQNVFVLASGKSIEQQRIKKDSTVVADDVQNCLGDTIELTFDGNDDQVRIMPNPIFDFGADRDFTVECRVRTTIAADVSIIGNKDWESGIFKGFVFSFKYASGPEWKVNIGDGDNRADINTGGAIADNEWHTLSVSFDRDGFMKMYQDGMILDSIDISSIGDITTNEGLVFGSDILGNFAYQGAIAEVRVWDTLLDNQSINQWHCTTLDDTHPHNNNLLGYWKLNEGSNSSLANDYSTYGNDGVINGATWVTPDSIVTYDYSLTPRLTDVVPSVLTHLCIPIKTDWSLDGSSLIPDCIISNLDKGPSTDVFSINIFPNPSSNFLTIQLDDASTTQVFNVVIYNTSGTVIGKHNIIKKEQTIDISNLPQGEYFINIIRPNGEVITKKLIVLTDK